MPLPPGFDAESNRRIADAVLWVEDQDDDAPPGRVRSNRAVNQPQVEFVQVVDLTAVSGRYKGRIESFDSSGGSITLFPADPKYIWIVFPAGVVPTTGTSFEARRYGDVAGVAVFRVVSGPILGTVCFQIATDASINATTCVGTVVTKYVRINFASGTYTVTDTPC